MTNNGVDEIYLSLAKDVLENGKRRSNRTGTDTLSVFGRQVRYDLRKGFPLLTTKKVHFHSVLVELLWFLRGDTNIKYLQDNGVKIWNEWATKEQCAKFGRSEGELGPVYGALWRHWEAPTYAWDEKSGIPDEQFQSSDFDFYGNTVFTKKIDQIANVIDQIKTNKDSRRLIVTGWNPATYDLVSLPPCHTLFQFYVGDGELSCQLYQRSADLFLGVPFNIASYALLTYMIAHVCGLKVGEFIHSFGDLHLYIDHIDQIKLQTTREPYPMPNIVLANDIKNIDDFREHHIELIGYNHHPIIKATVSV